MSISDNLEENSNILSGACFNDKDNDCKCDIFLITSKV